MFEMHREYGSVIYWIRCVIEDSEYGSLLQCLSNPFLSKQKQAFQV